MRARLLGVGARSEHDRRLTTRGREERVDGDDAARAGETTATLAPRSCCTSPSQAKASPAKVGPSLKPAGYAGRYRDPWYGDVVIADGAKFVAETKDRFDVIIVDSTDPIGPGEVLFTETEPDYLFDTAYPAPSLIRFARRASMRVLMR